MFRLGHCVKCKKPHITEAPHSTRIHFLVADHVEIDPGGRERFAQCAGIMPVNSAG